MAASVQKVRDLLRVGLNLVFSVGQVFASFVSSIFGIGVSIAARSAGKETTAQPAAYAFSIWGLIFPACIAYGIFQALPAERENPLLRRIGFYTAAAFIATALWAIIAQLRNNDWVLLIVISSVLLFAGIALARIIHYEPALSSLERYLIVFPISIFTAWITLATLVSLSSIIRIAGIESYNFWAIGIIIVAGLVGAYVTTAKRGNPWYGIIIIWGLTGTLIADLSREHNVPAAVVSGTMLLIVLLSLIRSLVLSRNTSG